MLGATGLYASSVALSADSNEAAGFLLSELQYGQLKFGDCPARLQR